MAVLVCEPKVISMRYPKYGRANLLEYDVPSAFLMWVIAGKYVSPGLVLWDGR